MSTGAGTDRQRLHFAAKKRDEAVHRWADTYQRSRQVGREFISTSGREGQAGKSADRSSDRQAGSWVRRRAGRYVDGKYIDALVGSWVDRCERR